jgi:hypothetical protein
MRDDRHSNVRRQTFACSHQAPKTAGNFFSEDSHKSGFLEQRRSKARGMVYVQTSSAQRWLDADDN